MFHHPFKDGVGCAGLLGVFFVFVGVVGNRGGSIGGWCRSVEGGERRSGNIIGRTRSCIICDFGVASLIGKRHKT